MSVSKNSIEKLKYTKEDIKQLFNQAIIQKCAKSQFILGQFYVYEKKNYKQGFKLYLQAAEQGHIIAQYRVAECYGNSYGVEYNMEEAFKWCKKASIQNHRMAQYQLGSCYEYGKGCIANIKEAYIWYTKASEQGVSEAKYNLGVIYETGKCGVKNTIKALELYTEAANKGLPEAQFKIGVFNESIGNIKEAFRYYKLSAENNDFNAQFKLGLIYKKAAEQDHNDILKVIDTLNANNFLDVLDKIDKIIN